MKRSKKLITTPTDELMAAYKSSLGNTSVTTEQLKVLFNELKRRKAANPEAYAIYEQLVEPDELLDPSTGTKLTPSWHGRECLGNGEWTGYECCCDECDHFLTCFPEA